MRQSRGQNSPKFNTSKPFRQEIQTPLGLVRIIGLHQEAPLGWRIVSLQQGKQNHDYFNKLMKNWGIVAFKKGKLDGPGYGNSFHDSYGSQCGQKFIVKMPEMKITASHFLESVYQNWDEDLLQYAVTKLSLNYQDE